MVWGVLGCCGSALEMGFLGTLGCSIFEEELGLAMACPDFCRCLGVQLLLTPSWIRWSQKASVWLKAAFWVLLPLPCTVDA